MSEAAAVQPLVEVVDLVRHFPHGKETVRAVDGVSLRIEAGQTLGLVGESGCGKSTLGRTLLRLYPVTSGRIIVDGQDITTLDGRDLRRMRRKMQMVFQDPLASLNPRMRVGDIVSEPLREHRLVAGKREASARVDELFELVSLPRSMRTRYPAELSGGQRQRVAIARALAVEPRFIVADEAVAALDVSVGAQVINLLDELRSRLSLSYLFISHDLSVVRHISDRVAVMYLGRIVESGPTERVFSRPLHPYTTALLSATPQKLEDRRERIILSGDPPSPIRPPSGCRFHTRCPIGPLARGDRDVCREREPVLQVAEGSDHMAACHFPGELVVSASVQAGSAGLS